MEPGCVCIEFPGIRYDPASGEMNGKWRIFWSVNDGRFRLDLDPLADGEIYELRGVLPGSDLHPASLGCVYPVVAIMGAVGDGEIASEFARVLFGFK